MGFSTKSGSKHFHRKGNTKIWFFVILVSIGLFLHYREKKSPWTAFKSDISNVFGGFSKEEGEASPTLPKYKEQDTNVATDDRRDEQGPEPEEEPQVLDSQFAESASAPETEGQSPINETGGESDSNLEAYLPSIKAGDQLIRHKGYTLAYVEAHEQAGWVLHLLRRNARGGKAKRAREFKPDPLVRTGSALPQDYARSGYDRGHLAPAGDFKYDQILTYETFYMSNMSPQKPELNQGIWNDMEIKIRDWASGRGDLVVVTGPVLKAGLPTIGKANDVSVPEQYYKIVYDPHEQTAIAFLMTNEGHYGLLKDLIVSIDEVEKLTGYDFFPKLSDKLEKQMESKPNTSDWY
jgi:endonuclease G, mitochondrial